MFNHVRLLYRLFSFASKFEYQFINPIISAERNVDIYGCAAILCDLTRTTFVFMTFLLYHRCMFYFCHL